MGSRTVPAVAAAETSASTSSLNTQHAFPITHLPAGPTSPLYCGNMLAASAEVHVLKKPKDSQDQSLQQSLTQSEGSEPSDIAVSMYLACTRVKGGRVVALVSDSAMVKEWRVLARLKPGKPNIFQSF